MDYTLTNSFKCKLLWVKTYFITSVLSPTGLELIRLCSSGHFLFQRGMLAGGWGPLLLPNTGHCHCRRNATIIKKKLQNFKFILCLIPAASVPSESRKLLSQTIRCRRHLFLYLFHCQNDKYSYLYWFPWNSGSLHKSLKVRSSV